MNVSFLLNCLNNNQLNAVTSSNKNILILAGAGSGKTRVLVHRIAWLLTIKKISPYSIMAVTFTNKAVSEIIQRISTLLDNKYINHMWIGTFHGIAHRLLRMHYLEANLPSNFQILDNDDQYYLIRRITKEMNLDKTKYSPFQIMKYINLKKNKDLQISNMKYYSYSTEMKLLKIYQTYQKICIQSGLVDFTELLLKIYELFTNKQSILEYYQNKFTNILVDEFQDTNSIQYAWLSRLISKECQVMIVGDDDQSIYGWRGAQINNIQYFLHDFSKVKVIRLEQNYRSTNNILKSANALIANNNNRFKKNLWTTKSEGELISLYCGFNESDEANYVINSIKYWHKKGNALKACAILYRNNIQSKIFEEKLLQSSISYCIYGGKSFLERQEIKYILSYLRLIINHNDDISFEKIINIPCRGIGKNTLNIIRQKARNNHTTLWKSCEILLQKKNLNLYIKKVIKKFLKLINTLCKEIINMSLYEQLYYIIHNSGLLEMYKKKNNEKSYKCIENIKEFIKIICSMNINQEIQLKILLSNITLGLNIEKKSSYKDAVQLMTIHAAKGLEFPMVFIVGMEEGLFPQQININNSTQLAEERRLAYVGLTRAMKKLTLTYASTRFLYGKTVYNKPSRFISEIPLECIKQVYY